MTTIEITYSIRSKKCATDLLNGTRQFTKQTAATAFIQRLFKVKCNLTERAAGVPFGHITRAPKSLATKIARTESPFILKYSCKTF